MPGTVGNTVKSPRWVVFNDVLLGLTEDEDITVTPDVTWNDQHHHQTGTHLVQSYFGGVRLTVTVALSEILEYDNWEIAFPFGQEQIDDSTPLDERFSFGKVGSWNAGSYVGLTATSIAQELRLIPLGSGATPSTDTATDFVLNTAFCRNASDIMFSVASGSALPLVFEGLMDPATAENGLAVFGNNTGSNWVIKP